MAPATRQPSKSRGNAPPRISYVVARLERSVRREIEERVKPYGLTVPQYTTLTILRHQGALSNAQLARRAYVRPQSMNQVIQLLERDGLIERIPDENHRRILRTRLTSQGLKILTACDRSVNRMEKAMLRDLSQEERDFLLQALMHAVAALGAEFQSSNGKAPAA
jgi:DNA-binding MarR family transcriptional regulator